MTYFICLLAMLVVSAVLAQAGEKIYQFEVSITEFKQSVGAKGNITHAEFASGIVRKLDWVKS